MSEEQTKSKPAAVTRRRRFKTAARPADVKLDPSKGVILTIPMVPLRGLAVFPGVTLTFDVAREKSRLAVKEAIDGNQLIFLTAQKDITQDWPGP